MKRPRDHGGNLDAAIARFGGRRSQWLDLSTGINPNPYPVGDLPKECWQALPRRADVKRLCDAASAAYDTQAAIIPFNGAQGAIQLLPLLKSPGRATIVGPTYNEHRASLVAHGWDVRDVSEVSETSGSDLAIVVNPNNPDGRFWPSEVLLELSESVGTLVIDESFVDPTPENSVVPALSGDQNVVVLRSFGKFYGLAGLRLGFALATGAHAERLSELSGPWPVAGQAIEIGAQALADRDWQRATITELNASAERLDALAENAGWRLEGGTALFRTYSVPSAAKAQDDLAASKVWSRIFPYSEHWIRLGLPARHQWDQLENAFQLV